MFDWIKNANWFGGTSVKDGIQTTTGGIIPGLGQGLSGLASLYSGYKQQKLAKEAFNFERDFAQKQLAQSNKAYNTQLEDVLRGRTSDYEGKEADIQAELARKRLS